VLEPGAEAGNSEIDDDVDPVRSATLTVANIRSLTLTSTTRELPFTISTAVFTQGGRMARRDCGRMIQVVRGQKVRPSDLAASVCPLGTEEMAPRMISETWAPAKRLKATTAAWNPEISTSSAGSP
jgi:hypothetical protein